MATNSFREDTCDRLYQPQEGSNHPQGQIDDSSRHEGALEVETWEALPYDRYLQIVDEIG